MTGSAASALAQWHGFLDALNDALLVVDAADGRIVFANLAALRALPSAEPGQPLVSLADLLPQGLTTWALAQLRGAHTPPPPGAGSAAMLPLSDDRWALRLPPMRTAARAPRTMLPPALPPGRTNPLQELRRMFWASPFPAILQDDHFLVVDVNDAFVDFCGVPRERLIGRDPIALAPREDHAAWRSAREVLRGEHASDEVPALVERRLIDAAGRERWYRAARRSVSDDEGRSFGLTVLQDCTAEHALRDEVDRSARELDQWFDLSPVGLLAFDASGLVLRSNPALEALLGRAPQWLGDAPAALRELLALDSPQALALLAPAGGVLERSRWVPGDGARRPRRLHARIRAAAHNQDAAHDGAPAPARRRYLAAIDDLTVGDERDLARAQLDALVEAAGAGLATWDGAQGWVVGSVVRGASHGGEPTSLAAIGRDVVEPETLAEFERVQRALRAGERAQARYAVRDPEHGTRWLLTRVEPQTGANGEQRSAVITLDITEQERAREAQEALLRELTSIMEASSAGIAYVRDGVLVRSNRRFEELLALRPGQAVGRALDALFERLPVALERLDATRGALDRDGVTESEFEYALPDGGRRWVGVSARRIDAAPGHVETIAVLTDITRLKLQQAELERLAREQARAQQAMARQAELTRAILDSVFVGIVTVGPLGIEWMNRSARRMFGGTLADFFHQPLETVATSEVDHPFRAAPRLLERPEGAEQGTASFECRVQARDGRRFWVVGNAVATGVADDAGALQPQLTYALLDIDRRRSAEARTAQAQATLQRMIDLAPLAITLFDAHSGRVRRINPVAAGAMGLAPEQVVGQRPAHFMADAPLGARVAADLADTLARGEVQRREYRFAPRTPGGEGVPRVWDARFLPLSEPGRAPDEVLMVATDVTEQREAEAARLAAAVAQREALVREVHHRIKNNLQGVAGLLQQVAQRRPEVATVLQDAVAQVQAIAQVYGLQVGQHGPVRLVSLVEAIARAVQRGERRVEVGVSTDGAAAPDWALPEAEAIPLALSLNELFGNALRHGGGAPVHCAVRLGEADAAVEIRNPGRLPDGFALERVAPGATALGLVRALIPRRGAALALRQDGDQVCASLRLAPPTLARIAADPAAVAP
ncbi:PAS domain-containing sensor histidine kinase [Caldimonas sp. KR1-144]|uniref:PAS domain-containing sensor histidine kinase n=1 Tax=Caldimonas sp. KR1-144 TaxID=3400911 RepID=UPI003C126823